MRPFADCADQPQANVLSVHSDTEPGAILRSTEHLKQSTASFAWRPAEALAATEVIDRGVLPSASHKPTRMAPREGSVITVAVVVIPSLEMRSVVAIIVSEVITVVAMVAIGVVMIVCRASAENGE